jgi:peptidoglycan/LPS O-acetylase OafA/YrhL
MVETAESSPPHSVDPPIVMRDPGKLAFLEGLRALTALYVLCFHAATVAPRDHLSWPCRWVLHVFLYGHYAVGVFIVVSGYCLMLPVAASPTLQLRGGLGRFAYRRAKRILPPYYAAFFISIPVSLFDKHAKHLALSMTSIVAHLGLFHNLSPYWAGDINPVMWTIATEWQIYFIFALVLLPLRRTVGMTWTVIIAIVMGLAPYLAGYMHQLWSAAYWYLALFAFGMAAAQMRFLSGQRVGMRPTPKTLLISCSSLFIIGVVVLQFYPFNGIEIIIVDHILGVATALLIAFCASAEGSRSRINKILSSNVLTTLGLFSYSLYLTHFPILATLDWFFKHLRPSDDLAFAFQFIVVVPVCVAGAYVFYRLFERPFLSTDRRGNVQVVPAVISAP